MVVFWNVILEKLNKVSVQIQSSSVDTVTISDLYGSLLKLVIAERENFAYFEESAIKMSELKRYQGDIKRQPKRRKFAHETSNNEIETISRDSFRVNIFLVILDRLRAELERRHNAYQNFKEKFSFLIRVRELSTPKVTEKVQSFVQNYPNMKRTIWFRNVYIFTVTFPLIKLQRNLNEHHYSISQHLDGAPCNNVNPDLNQSLNQ
jgi:hypothetical protein